MLGQSTFVPILEHFYLSLYFSNLVCSMSKLPGGFTERWFCGTGADPAKQEDNPVLQGSLGILSAV
jgi:hypothetical protein